MLVPRRSARDIIDGLMIDPFETFMDNAAELARPAPTLMKTDIKETDTAYELTIDLPGFKKEDVQAELKSGYLSVTAQTETATEDKDDDGTFLRKERFSGKCSRRFYIGEEVVEDEIKAKFKDGILYIDIPKKEPEQPEEPPKKVISIDG